MFLLFIIIYFIHNVYSVYFLKHRWKNKLKEKYYLKCKSNFNFEKIPKICYQTWKNKNLPKGIKIIRKKNKEINPDIKFILYDDQECENFIKNNFNKKIYNAYQKINYSVIKADFWRYCILYKKGGIYLDIKSLINTRLFDNIIKDDDICILDKFRKKWTLYRETNITNGSIEQYLLIFCKGHPYLETIINILTDNILNNQICIPVGLKKYNKNNTKEKILRLSGPDFIGAVINLYVTTNCLLHREIDYTKISMIRLIKNNIHYSEDKHYSEIDNDLLSNP